MSRAQTLVLALLALHLLLGGLCLAIARGEHKSPALRWWGWGLLAYAGGLLVTMTAALGMPRLVSNTLGNTVITFSAVLSAGGVLMHTPMRRFRLPAAIGVLATVAVLLAANLTGWNTLPVNVIAPTVVAVAFFLFAAWAIATQGPKDARAACRMLAACLVAAVATWVARIAALLAVLDPVNGHESVDLVLSLFAIAQMVMGVAATLSLVWIDVRIMQAELSRMAHTDALTGLLNRRAMRLRFTEEAARATRQGRKFALALYDIDEFKLVNDRHGHAVGDEVLRGVAAALGTAKRTEDALARIGGEEFLMVLAQPSIESAAQVAERLRAAVAARETALAAGAVSVTVSGGVALYPDDGADWDELFAAADRRLYAAKRAGRDRIDAAS